MTEETAREWLRTLNESEDAWPLGYGADGFVVGKWNFDYGGSGKWSLSSYEPGKGWVTFND